jgi:integrase
MESKWDGRKWFRLGSTEGEAWRTWVERVSPDCDATTFNGLFDSWWQNYVIPYLKPSTREGYAHHLLPLRKVFGHMRPASLRIDMAYKYRVQRPRVAGNRELSVLSSALDYAVSQGMVERNVLKGNLQRKGASAEPVRKRVPSLDEIEAFCQVAPGLRGYVALKLITGLRQCQMMSINLTEHWTDGKLTPPTSKGGRVTEYAGEALAIIIKDIIGDRLPRGWLFLNRKRDPVTPTGLKSAWRRAMADYVAAGGESFHEHDIRKTVATMADSLERAQKLLGHRDSRTTAQVYRVGPVKVDV